MTSLSERMTTLSESASTVEGGTLAARIPVDRPRELKEVSLVMVDGTEVRGVMHHAFGARTPDFLNKGSDAFVALTSVTVRRGEDVQTVPFVALNKSHIVRLIEAADPS
jgi:uncharacterized protein DUF6812